MPGETITFEYESAHPWLSGATPAETATSDTDVWRLDRRLLILGVKWRWKKEKGLEDWQVDAQQYQGYVNILRGRNEGARTLCFGDAPRPDYAPYTRLYQ